MEFISGYYHALRKYQDCASEMQLVRQESSDSENSRGYLNSFGRNRLGLGSMVDIKAQLSISISENSQNENQAFRSLSIKRKCIQPMQSNPRRGNSLNRRQADNRQLEVSSQSEGQELGSREESKGPNSSPEHQRNY